MLLSTFGKLYNLCYIAFGKTLTWKYFPLYIDCYYFVFIFNFESYL